MNKFTAIRLDTSGYCNADFQAKEKAQIEALGVCYYHLNDIKEPNSMKDQELILISTSNINPEEIPINLLNKTKLMIHPNSGYDNLNPWYRDQHFPVVIGSQIRSQAVAEYALSCVFDSSTKIKNDSKWNRSWDRKLIRDLNIALIGIGHIGEIIHQSLSALGASLQVYDPFKGENTIDWAKADIIILAPSLDKASKHILNKSVFDQIKENIVIINPARGGLINESDLIDFLKTSPDSYAYLDVFETEPTDYSQFQGIPNIRHTSHRAGVYKDLDLSIIQYTTQVMNDFINSNDFNSRYEKMILGRQKHH